MWGDIKEHGPVIAILTALTATYGVITTIVTGFPIELTLLIGSVAVGLALWMRDANKRSK